MTLKPKILYIVATQYDNLGDLLINKCVIDKLAEYGDVYLDLENVPSHFKIPLLDHPNTYDLKSIANISFKGPRLLLFPFLKDINFTHVFKSPGPFGRIKSSTQKLHALTFWVIFRLLKSKGSKNFLLGNDIILESKFDEFYFKSLSKLINTYYVRSSENKLKLHNLNILNTEFIPDAAFLLNPKSVPDLENKCTKIGISFRKIEGGNYFETIRQSVSNIVDYYSKIPNSEIIFFQQVDRDKEFMLELYEPYKKNNAVHFHVETLTWEEKDFYEKIRIVFSNRLHVLLLSAAFHTVPIALINESGLTEKIKNIFQSSNLMNHVYRVLNNSEIEAIEDNFVEIKTSTISNFEIQRLKAETIIDGIFS